MALSKAVIVGSLAGMLLAGCQFMPRFGSSAGPTAEPPTQPAGNLLPPVALRAPVIALVLGGGAARGFAHVGVIKGLEARGIHPDIIVGTSAGSLVGALYASGRNGFELNQLALTMDEATLSDWALPSRGVFRGAALQDYVNRQVKNLPMEKFPRRFAATATDLRTGDLMVFERGNAGQAVRASSAVPGVFEPVTISGREYVDGGLVSPVPVRVARRMGADVVIAVDISSRPDQADTSGLVGTMMQAFAIMGRRIGENELTEADVVIRPELPNARGTDFRSRNATVLAGEEAVARAANSIRSAIAARQRATPP